MGVVTRAGCGPVPELRRQCYACRGLISDPNTNAAKDILAENGLT